MSNAIVKRTADMILADKKDQFLAVLPKNVDRERFYAVAIAICKDRALAECTDSSKLDAVYRIAKLGLDPDPVFGEAYVLPRSVNIGSKAAPKWVKAAQFQPGYRGLTKLARNSRGIADIQAEVVYEGEEFFVRLGTHREVHHEPWYSTGLAAPTKIKCAYVTWRDMTSGQTLFHVVSSARIARAKAASKSGNVWATDEAAMTRKTAIIDASKTWPLSAELAEAIRADELQETDEPQPLSVPAGMVDAPADGPAKSELDDFVDAEIAPDGGGEMSDAEKTAILEREAAEAKGGK